jgi:hypothetical protein
LSSVRRQPGKYLFDITYAEDELKDFSLAVGCDSTWKIMTTIFISLVILALTFILAFGIPLFIYFQDPGLKKSNIG